MPKENLGQLKDKKGQRIERKHTMKLWKLIVIAISDQKIFFKLINRQLDLALHKQMQSSKMEVHSQMMMTSEMPWRDYFHKLGTPDPNPQFDDSYLKQFEADIEVITRLNENSCDRSPAPITTEGSQPSH